MLSGIQVERVMERKGGNEGRKEEKREGKTEGEVQQKEMLASSQTQSQH